MKSSKHFTNILAVAALLIPGMARVGTAQLCGDTITVPTTMVGDLNCPDSTVLTIGPGGSLDMNGHTVSCSMPGNEGIVITGSGATLANGTVSGCANNVVVQGSGGNIIRRIMSLNASGNAFTNSGSSHKNLYLENFARNAGIDCFILNGDRHTLTRNVADTCGARGIQTGDYGKLTGNIVFRAGTVGIKVSEGGKIARNVVEGANLYGTVGIDTGTSCKFSGNIVSAITGNCFIVRGSSKGAKNRASACTSSGYLMNGDKIKLKKNRALGNGAEGFGAVSGDLHDLKANTASGNGGVGFQVSGGDGYKLKANVAAGNTGGGVNFTGTNAKIGKNYFLSNGALDITDNTVGCGTNVWSGNIFGTKSQVCEQ